MHHVKASVLLHAFALETLLAHVDILQHGNQSYLGKISHWFTDLNLCINVTLFLHANAIPDTFTQYCLVYEYLVWDIPMPPSATSLAVMFIP